MEITLEKKDKVNASLKVRLKEDDYKTKYTTKLKEYGKKVQLKGFRPGHVPAGLVEKMYGKSILVDEINSIVSESINGYLKDNQVEILGDPMPNAKDMASIDWDNQKEFDFTYNLGLSPEFSLELSDKVVLEKFVINPTDKSVKETIENLRKQFGTYTDTEVIESEDMIYADATDAAGKTYKAILPEYRIDEKAKKQFLGAKKGDVIVADIRTVLTEEAAIAHVLGVDKKDTASISGEFSFNITRISHPSNAELAEEFYGKVFRGAEIKTYEDFEAKVKENVSRNYEIESKNALFSDVFEYFTKNTKIELPEDFLKDWLYVVNEGKISKEEIATQFPSFESSLKWDLIKNFVAKQADIKVEHEEVLAKAKNLVAAQFGLADSQLDGEMAKLVDQFANNVLQRDNGKEYRRFFEEAFGEKVLEYIISKIKLKEKSVDPEEFRKMRDSKK